MGAIGWIGCMLFFIKVALHGYLRYKMNEKVIFGSLNNPERISFFLPIFKEVPPNLKALKKVINILYRISMLMIFLFVIDYNLHKH